jgi:predicted amidohydrolase
MAERLRVAALQMHSGTDVDENLAIALDLIDQAATAGAEVVSLPEFWDFMGPEEDAPKIATTVPGPLTAALAAKARQHRIFVYGGSIHERQEGDPLLQNTTVLIDPDGRIITQYRKIHLFDVSFAGHFAHQESAGIRPGTEIVTASCGDIPVGFSTCYDLRFPELFRILALRGAKVIFLPAAFTLHTGKDHWEVLIRARAIENQCFMVAAAQFGKHPSGAVTYGRSMIVDPWGLILAQAADGMGMTIAELDFAMLERIRRELPSLQDRRPTEYVWSKEGVGIQ